MNDRSSTPLHIAPTEDGRALRIDWADGHSSAYEPRYLRLQCPCAACVEETSGRALIRPGAVPEDVMPVEIQYVGRYALLFHWSDGHATGIYPFSYLRGLCLCEECLAG